MSQHLKIYQQWLETNNTAAFHNRERSLTVNYLMLEIFLETQEMQDKKDLELIKATKKRLQETKEELMCVRRHLHVLGALFRKRA